MDSFVQLVAHKRRLALPSAQAISHRLHSRLSHYLSVGKFLLLAREPFLFFLSLARFPLVLRHRKMGTSGSRRFTIKRTFFDAFTIAQTSARAHALHLPRNFLTSQVTRREVKKNDGLTSMSFAFSSSLGSIQVCLSLSL